MCRTGFEHTILVFERAKTFHFLDRAATVIKVIKFNVYTYFCFGILAASINCVRTNGDVSMAVA
jgi:hypothetical protein